MIRDLTSRAVARDEPRYVQGPSRSELWAHFHSGAVVRVESGRVRRYPGLEGPAPPTRSFYLQLLALDLRAEHVLDAGCGSGIGTAQLAGAFPSVTGVDKDRIALEYAGRYEPRAQYVRATFGAGLRLEPCQAAICADLLGHVSDPELVVAELRSACVRDARLLVAEPQADPFQCLLPPARRAFSRRGLEALLIRSGFEIETWCDSGSFLIAVARPCLAPGYERVQSAVALIRQQRPAAALELIRRVDAHVPSRLGLEAQLVEARARLELAELDTVLDIVQRAESNHPYDPRPLLAQAALALEGGSVTRAAELAARAVRLDPGDASAARAAARLADVLGHPDASMAWQIAHNLAPSEPETAARLAEELRARGQMSEARAVLQRQREYEKDVGRSPRARASPGRAGRSRPA
ncbi:MAG: methyltransferase domain-containing protein [Polyangiaceae bacterium]|nr:methyltransferase domain-containing protein [Polyangiaceae bacterium]